MPMLLIDALHDSHKSEEKDISTYVFSCAGSSWTYDKHPRWANDEKIWEKIIILGEDGLLHIDLKNAVIEQLIERGIGHIIINKVDTITDPRFYSNSAARTKVKKKGRNYVGTFYK